MLFDWDEFNIDHLAHHAVIPAEAEEAILDPHRVMAPAYSTPAEPRVGIIGATESGRVLFVVFVRRHGLVRVVTARTADPVDVRRYRRRRR